MRLVTLHERCIAYARSVYGQKWPDSIPYVTPSGRFIYGHWSTGDNFRNATSLPGCYPRTMLERLLVLFPEVRPNRILHAFSGSVPNGRHTRLDVREEPHPGVRPEARRIRLSAAHAARRPAAAAGVSSHLRRPAVPRQG